MAPTTVSSARARGLLRICLHSDGGLGIDELELTAEESLLDCGAGDGGPARRRWALTPLLSNDGGCRAAQSLYGFPVCTVGSALAAG